MSNVTFILDKRLKSLNKEIEEILFNIKNPLAGEKIHIIKTFTKELIHACAIKNQHSIRKTPPKEALIISTSPEDFMNSEFDIPPLDEDELDAISPIEPELQLTRETLNIEPRGSREIKQVKEEKVEKIENIKPQIKIPEEIIGLITSKVTGEEMAYAVKKGLFYMVYESNISPEEIKVLNSLRPILEKNQSIFHDKNKFVKLMKKQAKRNKVNPDELSPSKLRYFLIKHLINFGLIDPLLHDSEITKITCDGPNLKIKITRGGEEYITNLEFKGRQQLDQFIKLIAKKSSQKISDNNPVLEANFENFRISATLGTEDIPSRFILEKTV
ncbi:MAG: hypothetical protein Q8Q42_01865 [Nanoarchaeota archaeon]|nr:hypothetical protein [Nanoarchaeota archaeon]